MANGQTGNQATASFSGSSFSPNYISLGQGTATREELDDTSLSNSSAMSSCPSDLPKWGARQMRFYYSPSAADDYYLLINSSVQTLTITYNSSEVLTSTGFVTEVTDGEIVNGALMEGTITWQPDGKPTFTSAS